MLSLQHRAAAPPLAGASGGTWKMLLISAGFIVGIYGIARGWKAVLYPDD
jgi:hypothetical protein